jgi:hypothetical protein
VVQVGGNAVDLAELKSAMMSIEQIEDIRLDILDDDVLGHKIKATVKVGDESDNFRVKDLRRVLKRKMSLYKIPAEFLYTKDTNSLFRS